MFSSMLRQMQHTPPRRVDHDRARSHSPSPGPANRAYAHPRHATADFTEADDDEEEVSNEGDGTGPYQVDPMDEDGPSRLPVLPLFSSSYLDSLAIYAITHSIRILVQTRTETTLTWDQLRSPQVSQFLIKPMQQQIRAHHYSRATLYCLMANCLQFNKEAQMFPGNAGISRTRARACELLALKTLKEYTTRELIDALSYDFYPLQGLPGTETPTGAKGGGSKARSKSLAARTSTLEVAIRASAKHFLAHPLVVQHLEAIWNGAVSFYSAADSLHRGRPPTPVFSLGTKDHGKTDVRTPLLGSQSSRDGNQEPGRRTVTLYDPRQASLFKLSRLRVPRYRFFLSTLSLGILIGLFLAVLSRRSARITTLELVFWFWSAGFMLDELVGFNEQGFSLYIMSFWNIFDLGILVLLIVYYCMRGYGVFLVDPHHWNDMAYDVLAANAILLLPRIFSVLDHYPYFSQLLIAFRLMAVDMAAVTVLVLVSCSGFFVFFTMSQTDSEAPVVAYKIFQILMGFTPAAWEVWPTYNWLAKSLMVLFLILCHFLVVTILITVLTNSFMAIASNATEEHQFLFAINTISMVKNDALFSYVAPGNILAWLIMPARYFMSLHNFVWLNRLVIKATHFPLLFCIFFYERYWLAPAMFEPTDLVENPGRGRPRTISFADPASRTAVFSPHVRVREESVTGYQKDHALEEVFRRVPDLNTLRSQRRTERRKTQNAIRNWMDQNEEMGSPLVQWPSIESRSVMPEWARRYSLNPDRPHRLRQVSDVRSAASDPADLISNSGMGTFPRPTPKLYPRHHLAAEVKDQTDADGDDELVTNDEEEEEDNVTHNTGERGASKASQGGDDNEDYFTTPMASRFQTATPSSLGSSSHKSTGVSPRSAKARHAMHSRTLSTNTILYNPQQGRLPRSASSAELDKSPLSRQAVNRNLELDSPTAGKRSPRRSLYMAAATRQQRPAPTSRTPGFTAATTPRDIPIGAGAVSRPVPTRRLSVDTGQVSNNTGQMLGVEDPNLGVPSSFQTQMAMAMMKQGGLGANPAEEADRDRMGRLVLARMKTLEESFADVIREMRELKSATAPNTRRNSSSDRSRAGIATVEVAGRDRRRGAKAEPYYARKRVAAAARRPVRGKSASSKDKGKAVAVEVATESSDEGGAHEEGGFTRRGSSF
ncbi:related to YVC1 - vacuolar cation channel [Cephalotrichum gorgonifer]|uniref:Related to YVC1 - vacuolar cation channel n=1 Tax=Cephalotrichum gorgonifer TaxID=2041049 RepID=A0AAE8MTD1_9PEZI|nr:related to YVC1 - vacuolar cation channel [Cephalotrichum gorgonifer]